MRRLRLFLHPPSPRVPTTPLTLDYRGYSPEKGLSWAPVTSDLWAQASLPHHDFFLPLLQVSAFSWSEHQKTRQHPTQEGSRSTPEQLLLAEGMTILPRALIIRNGPVICPSPRTKDATKRWIGRVSSHPVLGCGN